MAGFIRVAARKGGAVELLRGAAFDELFRTFGRDAFHLEVRERAAEQPGSFERFLAGEPDDLAWRRPWLDLVRAATGAGRTVRRVSVVEVPHTDHTRWALGVADHDVAAGAEVRWLPSHFVGPGSLTADDYWLFDDDLAVFPLYEADGRFAGGAATTDPDILDRCRAVRDRVWRRALPHGEYQASDFVQA